MPDMEPVRRVVSKKQPIQAGPVNLDWKLAWAAVGIVVSTIVVIVSTAVHESTIGLVFVVLVVLLWALLIGFQPFDGLQTAALTKLYRRSDSQVGEKLYTSDRPQQGESIGLKRPKERRPKPLPRIGRIDIVPYETLSGPLGIAWDHRYNTYSSTLWCAGSSQHSADTATQERILNGFAGLLNDMAPDDSPAHRFTFRVQTLLGERLHPERILEGIRKAANLTRKPPSSQRQLVQNMTAMGEESIVHRTTMTLSIYAAHHRREAKAVGGIKPYMYQYVQDFYASAMGTGAGLSPIGLKSAGALSYNELVLENRLALDPVFAQPLWEDWAGPENDRDLLSPHDAWPKYVNYKDSSEWCQLGSTYHKGFYVSSFTRSGMFPDQFWNILRVPIPKTVTVVFKMVSPHQAQLLAEFATAGVRGTNLDRLGSRRRVTKASEFREEEVTRHENEIARNIGQVGIVACYIDVTAASLEELNENATQLRKAWTDARFIVEPLNGMQYKGIDAVMPFGRGLPTAEVTWL